MTAYKHPGIYIEEIPATRVIQGVPTSVAAFIGVAESGPCESPQLITDWNAYTRQFGNLTWHGFLPWAVYEFFQEGGASCFVVRIKQTDAGQGTAATAILGDTTLSAASMGTWGNSLQVCISSDTGTSPAFKLQVVVPDSILDPAEAPTDQATQLLIAYVKQNGLPTTSIDSRNYIVLESFGGISLADASFQARINTQSMFIRASVTGNSLPANTPTPVSLSGGRNPAWDFSGALESLGAVSALNLLAMPDTVAVTGVGGAADDAAAQSRLANEGLAVCEARNSLFYVIDPPYGQDVPGIVSFKNGTARTNSSPAGQPLDSGYGALYYPWAWVFNPVSNTSVPVPPSGPVLGRYASTDTRIGVWKSPAGVVDGALPTVTALFEQLTDADQDTLNPNGVNALRNLIHYGNVIYGARTVSQDATWVYVSVRRLFIYVEQSIQRGLQWVAFEVSDQSLWSAVTRDITTFLTTLWQQGALFGTTGQEAFFVTCDASNNPPEMRDLGQLCIDIGLAPVYPAEFVVTRIVLKTAGQDPMA